MEIKKLFHNKKAQFYIFVAVIFCSLALTLILGNFGARGYKVVFDKLQNNFVEESGFVVNSALYSGESPNERLKDFIGFYQNYSISRNVDFRMLYFLVLEDNIYANNLLDSDILVEASGETYELNSSSEIIMPKYDMLDVTIDGYENRLYFTNESSQLKMYFRTGILK
ncbi:MAG: hypothetical protein ACLFPQ_02090 [Candidatus Woesearchaeota archaeon]